MEQQKKYKILIVDDDKFLLGMYAGKFNNNGVEANIATTGLEAITKLKEGLNPDVILLDIIIPTMDGLEILEKIRKEKLAPNAKIVMLTNQGGQAEVEKAKSLDVAGYIVKATTIPSEVVEMVLKIIADKK